MTNLLNQFPIDLAAKIVGYVDYATRIDLSLVDRQIHAFVLSLIKSIRIFPDPYYKWHLHPSDMTENILINVMDRYPNLEQISFQLSVRETPYLKQLFTSLKCDPEKKLLSSVRKIQCLELDLGTLKDSISFNTQFLNAISHQNLESIRIRANQYRSALSGIEIQPVFKNSPNLKTFIYDGSTFRKTISISFPKESLISKVKFINWYGCPLTIESLKACEKLKELVIDAQAIKAFPFTVWNLTRLELKGIIPENDEELDMMTKGLSKLECLVLELKNISNEGMENLGKNLPNLKALQLTYEDLTNSGLDKLTKKMPLLQTIRLQKARNITHNGITAIARNCLDLRVIHVFQIRKIKPSGCDALIKNCKELVAIGFSSGGALTLKSMYALAKKVHTLRYIAFHSNIDDKHLKEFNQKFPILNAIPLNLSLKKLHSIGTSQTAHSKF